MKQKALCLLVLPFLSNLLYGSVPVAGTGSGTERFLGNAQTTTMGGVLYTDSTLQITNIEDPTSLHKAQTTLLQIGGQIFSPMGNETEASGEERFDYIALGFPISKKTAVMASLIAETDYEHSWNINDTVYSGSGGISSARISVSRQLFKNLALGLEGRYLFGQLFNATPNPDTLSLRGYALKGGLRYTKSFNESIQLEATTYAVIGTLNKDQFLLNNDRKDISFPNEYSFNLGIGKPANWFLGLRYTFEERSVLSALSDFGQINNLSPADKNTYALGGTYFLQKNKKKGKHISLIGGIRYGTYGVKAAGKELTETVYSLGANIPFPKSPSILTLSAGFGTISGSSAMGLASQDFLTINIGFNFMKKWFVKHYYNCKSLCNSFGY